MSKVTTAYPSYASGTININGKDKASTTASGSSITSNYNMNDSEKAIYDYTQQALLNYLPQINTFSDETNKNIQSQLDAYKNKGIKALDQIYTPMFNNIKNDIASRFGNLDNSIFMNKLNSLETNKLDAINSLVENLLSKQNELYNNELSNRYNYLNFINDLQNSTTANILNYINSSMNASKMGMEYNDNMYNSMFKQALAIANYNLAANKAQSENSKMSGLGTKDIMSLVSLASML